MRNPGLHWEPAEIFKHPRKPTSINPIYICYLGRLGEQWKKVIEEQSICPCTAITSPRLVSQACDVTSPDLYKLIDIYFKLKYTYIVLKKMFRKRPFCCPYL